MAPADPDYLQAIKARLADIADIDQLSVTMVGGRMVFGIHGKQIGLDPFAADAEIETAIRLALSAPSTPAPAAAAAQIETPMPAANAAPAPATTKATPMASITGAAPATLSIKQMIEASRVKVKGAHEKLIANAAKVSQAADALDGLGDDLGTEADDLLAMVGQYKNDLG